MNSILWIHVWFASSILYFVNSTCLLNIYYDDTTNYFNWSTPNIEISEYEVIIYEAKSLNLIVNVTTTDSFYTFDQLNSYTK